jgi:hypothetical protein
MLLSLFTPNPATHALVGRCPSFLFRLPERQWWSLQVWLELHRQPNKSQVWNLEVISEKYTEGLLEESSA